MKPKRDNLIYQIIDAALRHVLRLLPTSTWAEHVALWWGRRFQPAHRTVRLRSGALIQVDPNDYLQLLIYYLGTFEPHCLRYLRRCTRSGQTILDIGANIGIYTLESSLAVGPTGRVISVEAAPPHIAALRNNIQLNEMCNVTLIEAAVGDSTGEATLTLPKGNNLGMFTLGSVNGDESYRVPLRPIDDLLKELGVQSVDLIKMDIEGSEYRALCGASKTLAQCKPVLLIELNEIALNRSGTSTREVKQFLRKANYRGWVLGRREVKSIPESQVTHDCDECLFIHRSDELLMHKLRLPK